MEKESQIEDSSANRRGFVRRIMGLVAAGGIASVLLGRQVEQATAANQGEVWFDNGAGGHSTDSTFRWTSSSLGIGTSTPQKLLHLVGSNPRILIESSDSTAPEVNFKGPGDEASRVWSLYKHGGTHDLRFYQGGDKVTIQDGTGNVGIGTTSPQALLHVAGTTPNILLGDSANSITSGVLGGTVGGGGAAGHGNMVTGNYGTVGGGNNNTSNAGSTVSGGAGNHASSSYSTVGGGDTNTAGGNRSTVGGGVQNNASSNYCTVGGGYSNTASGDTSTVGGGMSNVASGVDSTVPGGLGNRAAGDYSFAAGRRGKIGATHAGAFLYADSNDADFNSVAANEFAVRCTGGARFVTATDGSKVTAITPDGNVGIGTASPVRMLHIQGTNAVARLDRDVDSASFIFTRTAAGNFNTVWKTFTFGVKATGVNNGSFFIGDMGTNVTGSSQNRLLIDTSGNVGIGTTTPSSKLHVAGRVKALGYDTGDITFANGVRATEEGQGLAFLNDAGEKIAILDREGNFHIKGKFVEDL